MTFLWVQLSGNTAVLSLRTVLEVLDQFGLGEEAFTSVRARLRRCGVGDFVRVTEGGLGGTPGVGVFVRLGADR